jgi:leader peptidase (prepilin peptidase)/N-methyltransferase
MLVDRIPDATRLSLRSRCPFCEHPLAVGDTVPVVSWFRLRGTCRHCGERITGGYPFVEALTMVGWVVVAARYGWDWSVLPPLVLVTALVALSTIDYYTYRLPDRLVFPSLAVSAAAMVIAAVGLDRPSALGRAAIGMVLYATLLFVAHLVSPRGMGFGDVKLALLLGLHLGWAAGIVYVDWVAVVNLVIWALMLGAICGVVVGLGLGIARLRFAKDAVPDPENPGGGERRLGAQTMPFGPSLALGTMVVVLWAEHFA